MLLLALVVYVVAEIAAFVAVAEQIGVLLAVLILVVISASGPFLVRRAGFGVLDHARERIASGESPDREVLDGVVLLLAGVLICVPGFIGDAIGLALLVAPVRHLLIRLSGRALARRLGIGIVGRVGRGPRRGGPVVDASSHPGHVADVDEVRPPEIPPPPG
jgi:UPF0716 protein FxsA